MAKAIRNLSVKTILGMARAFKESGNPTFRNLATHASNSAMPRIACRKPKQSFLFKFSVRNNFFVRVNYT
jgi:hypothetical protein